MQCLAAYFIMCFNGLLALRMSRDLLMQGIINIIYIGCYVGSLTSYSSSLLCDVTSLTRKTGDYIGEGTLFLHVYDPYGYYFTEFGNSNFLYFVTVKYCMVFKSRFSVR